MQTPALKSVSDLVGRRIVAATEHGDIAHLRLDDGSLICAAIDDLTTEDGRLLINPAATMSDDDLSHEIGFLRAKGEQSSARGLLCQAEMDRRTA